MESVFAPMLCRECGETIQPTTQVAGMATTPAASIYVCGCGFRYSNNKSEADRTAFAPSAEQNVPERYRGELSATLADAANIGNLNSKISKFAYSTSEDAVTWTIFNWLAEKRSLQSLAEATGGIEPEGEPELLFWGAPVGGGATVLSQQLREVSLGVDGHPARLTEPDLVIAWSRDIYVVEVKYRASNESKPGYPSFARYTAGPAAHGIFSLSPEEIAGIGWYELTRNWRIGAELASTRSARFTLVNLGPSRLAPQAASFEATLEQTENRRFAFLRWKVLLELARRRAQTPKAVSRFIAGRDLEGSRWG